jgi:hypothetical protein
MSGLAVSTPTVGELAPALDIALGPFLAIRRLVEVGAEGEGKMTLKPRDIISELARNTKRTLTVERLDQSFFFRNGRPFPALLRKGFDPLGV